jgi:membrane protease YdiL (CAAX protease family)
MSTSLILAFVWFIIANVLAMVPSRDNQWRRAYVLIALGVPLIGYVTYENGPWLGLAVLAAGASVLRWPVIYLGRWMQRYLNRREGA